MNKLVFSSGGQPVYLEDLKLLQDNMMELVRSLFLLSHGSDAIASDDEDYANSVGLPVYATARHINGCGDANLETMQAHKLITAEGVYDVPEFTLHEGDAYLAGYDGFSIGAAPLYYLLEEKTVESREFEDGQIRPFVKSCTAKIVIGAPGTGTYYKVSDVPSFDFQLETLLGIKRRVNKSYYALEIG